MRDGKNSSAAIPATTYLTSLGSAQASPGLLPHTVQLPKLSFNIGLFVAQVPLNSSPLMICRILIIRKEIPKTTKMTNIIIRNSVITLSLFQY